MKKIALILAISTLVGATSFWLLMDRRHAAIETTRVDRAFSASAYALPFWGSGAAFAIVSGELDGTARIEIVGNRERDHNEFLVGPGQIEIVRGGAEEWIEDYHIRYTPITATTGRLYASVYCGDGMKDEDRRLHDEISRRN